MVNKLKDKTNTDKHIIRLYSKEPCILYYHEKYLALCKYILETTSKNVFGVFHGNCHRSLLYIIFRSSFWLLRCDLYFRNSDNETDIDLNILGFKSKEPYIST